MSYTGSRSSCSGSEEVEPRAQSQVEMQDVCKSTIQVPRRLAATVAHEEQAQLKVLHKELDHPKGIS